MRVAPGRVSGREQGRGAVRQQRAEYGPCRPGAGLAVGSVAERSAGELE